jgi:hypothetical protein
MELQLMAKPPPKKRQPTLRELLERDAKNPLRELGVFDEVNKAPLENIVSDIQDEQTMQSLMERAKRGYGDYQSQQVPLGPPQEVNPNQLPKPITTNPAKLLFDVLTLSSPAGVRTDTELAMMREANPKVVSDRRLMRFMKAVKAPQSFTPRAELGNLRDLLGVPRK